MGKVVSRSDNCASSKVMSRKSKLQSVENVSGVNVAASGLEKKRLGRIPGSPTRARINDTWEASGVDKTGQRVDNASDVNIAGLNKMYKVRF